LSKLKLIFPRAYDILSDKEKRKLYDRQGLSQAEQEDLVFQNLNQKEEVHEAEAGFFIKELESNHDDVFYEDAAEYSAKITGNEEIFNIMKKEQEETFGSQPYERKNIFQGKPNKCDIIHELSLTVEDLFYGSEKVISINKYMLCERCNGESRYEMEKNIEMNKNKSISCYGCFDQGILLKEIEEKITIPKGVQKYGKKTVLFLPQKGHYYFQKSNKNSFKMTDLYIRVEFKDHNYYQILENNNVATNNYIFLSSSVFGGEIKIKTLHGEKIAKIPKNTKNGTRLTLKGMGLPIIGKRNQFTDHIITLNIHIPNNMTSDIKNIFEKMIKFENDKHLL
jgi:DnaJ-class molecular chaperone